MITILLILLGILALTILSFLSVQRRNADLLVWKKFIEESKIKMEQEARNFPYRALRASGKRNGRNIQILERQKFANIPLISVEIENSEMTFEISHEGGFSKSGWNISFAKKVGILKDFDTGDAQFDEVFFVKSSDESRIRILLNEEIRGQMLELSSMARGVEVLPGLPGRILPRFLLKEGQLQYMEVNFIRMDDAARQRFELALSLLSKMAERI